MKNEFRQVVRLAPPGEIRAFVVYEHQLDSIAQGQPAAQMLNFSLFFLGIAATGYGTLAALPRGQDKTYYTFLIIALVCSIAGVVLLVLWRAIRRPVDEMIARIKAQMPINLDAEQLPAGTAALDSGKLHSSTGG